MAVSILPFLVLGFLTTVDANAFLGPQHQNATASMSADSEHTLLAELEVALGGVHRHSTERRLKRIEQMLQPMFGAVTKNEHGKLDSAAAGYMLHRVFVQRHGWFIRALEPAGGSMAAWNSSSPTSILEERVPEHVQNLFESRLGERGLGLKEVSVLASTLEHLVHLEGLDRLKVAYRGANYSQEDVLSEDEAMNVVEVYMAIYIASWITTDMKSVTGKQAQELHANILQLYPTWPETQQFLREVYRSVAPKRDYLYFNEVENVIAEVAERYGRFQDLECRQFKDWLVAVEDPGVGGAGRVRISDFYGQALNNGKWQFSESIDYLRQLGALDESDSSNLRVIIPNYVSSASNCVASSSYYSVCCMDECEGILGRLEQMISAPEASPSTIIKLVGSISSASVPSDRTLSPWLHHRLDEVAKHHGGVVPLHGRLFAQWLHFAYPRECTFPHSAGTIDPQRPEDLAKAHGTMTSAELFMTTNKTEMNRIVAGAAPVTNRVPGAVAAASEESAMWSMQEELVVWRAPPQAPKPAWMRFGAPIALLGAVGSLSVALVQSLNPALKAIQQASSDKYYV